MVQYTLVIAGGKGLRMGYELLKWFFPIGGESVLMRTIEAFCVYNVEIRIVLMLLYSQQSHWNELCREHHSSTLHYVADGGGTRLHSVKNGLAFVITPGLVEVYGGVRPFVVREVIARCYSLATEKQMVIPVTDVVEMMRHLVGEGSETVNHDEYKLMQAPQVSGADLLKQAYEQPHASYFINDASVAEALGKSVYLTEDNRENIKITTPFDLKITTALLGSCSI